MDLTKTYNYWICECKYKEKDSVWTNTTLGASISAYKTYLLINKREKNAQHTPKLHVITYEKATNYFLSELFSGFGFKGFKLAIIETSAQSFGRDSLKSSDYI